MDERTILLLAVDRLQPLDLVGPHEVFAGARSWLEHHGGLSTYRIEVVGAAAGPVVAESGLTLHAARQWRDVADDEPIDTLIVAGGDGVDAAMEDRELVEWIATTGARSRRVASVCSGALLLAAGGILDGRRATTHWARAEQLAREFPDVEVDVDPIHIVDGPVWTSAGVTAGIDLALAMVEADHGGELAQLIARHLVMFLRRPGGQSQFATAVWSEPVEREPIRRAQDLIHAEPGADHSVPRLAREIGMSERNFSRMFTRDVGVPPGRYVERVRVDAAKRMLEQETTGVAGVARSAGFGTAETMRRAFLRHVGVAPSDYRERFTPTTETVR
jgi:transcriptional regulator GlxA family with amidase domain